MTPPSYLHLSWVSTVILHVGISPTRKNNLQGTECVNASPFEGWEDRHTQAHLDTNVKRFLPHPSLQLPHFAV